MDKDLTNILNMMVTMPSNLFQQENALSNSDIEAYIKNLQALTTISSNSTNTILKSENTMEVNNKSEISGFTPLSPMSDSESAFSNDNNENQNSVNSPPATPPMEDSNIMMNKNDYNVNLLNYPFVFGNNYMSLMKEQNTVKRTLTQTQQTLTKRVKLENGVAKEVKISTPETSNAKIEKKKSKEGGRKITCYNCHTDTTPLWRRTPDRLHSLCNACGLYYKQYKTHRPLNLQHKVSKSSKKNNNGNNATNVTSTKTTSSNVSIQPMIKNGNPILAQDINKSITSSSSSNLFLTKNYSNNLDLLNSVTSGNNYLTTSSPLNTTVTSSALLASAASTNPQILSTLSASTDIMNSSLLLNNSDLLGTVALLNSQKQTLKGKNGEDLSESDLLYQNRANSLNSVSLNTLMSDTSYILSKGMEANTNELPEVSETLVNSQLEEKKFRSEVECMNREDVQRLLTNYEKRCEFLRGYLMATRNRI